MHPNKKPTQTRGARKAPLSLIAGGRAETKPAKRLAPRPRLEASEPKDGRILVPRFDASGAAISRRAAARWHLLTAANVLAAEYELTRKEGDALASAIAGQLWRCLADDGRERASLKKMAHGLARGRPKIDKSDAERWLLDELPATAAEARDQYRDEPSASAEGATNLARWALIVLASQRHADAADVLRRWGVEGMEGVFCSPKFAEDVGSLASEVRLLMLEGNTPEGRTFAEALVERTYRLLQLKRPLEALKKKRSR